MTHLFTYPLERGLYMTSTKSKKGILAENKKIVKSIITLLKGKPVQGSTDLLAAVMNKIKTKSIV